MRKGLSVLALVIGVGLVSALLFSQPFQDPLFHSFRPGDPSAGVYWGTTFPSIASTGTQPPDGVLFVQRTADAVSAPQFWMYSGFAADWVEFLSIGAAGLTDNTVPVWDDANNVFIDSAITDDATDVAITNAAGDITLDTTGGDDLFLTSADDITFVITDSFLITSDNFNMTLALANITTTADIVFTTTDVGDINSISAADIWLDAATNVNIDGGNSTIDVLNGGDIDLTPNANVQITPAGAQLLLPAGTAAAPPLVSGDDVDTGPYFIGANNFGISVGGALVMDFEDTNAAGAGANLVTISSIMEIMDDGADIFRGLAIDLTSVDHTGGVIDGINLGNIVDDAQSTETGLHIGTGWPTGIDFDQADSLFIFRDSIILQENGTTGRVLIRDTNPVGASTDAVVLDYTLSAMSDGDTFRGLFLDLESADHTGAQSFLYGIDIDGVTSDPDAYESNINLQGGWDTHITFYETGASPADNPPAGAVALFLDGNADYSGGGGNDCVLATIDAGGAIVIVATVTLNGACP